MRRGAAVASLLLAALAGPLAAEAPSRSLRPMPRPVAIDAAPVAAVAVAPAAAVASVVPGGIGKSLRPMPRPGAAAIYAPTLAAVAEAAPIPATQIVSVTVARADAATPRPMPRPDREDAPAQVAAASPAPRTERRGGLFGLFGGGNRNEGRAEPAPASGYVCGDPAIKGAELAPITSRTRGCGIEAPVRVTQVSGIRLSTAATIDCPTAAALKRWVESGLKPSFRKEIVEIRIAASYICRTRNNQRGAKISEHGRGKAVDVAGLVFADGREVSVLRDYGREFRRAHKAACGIFGTTLGPGSDGYHEDHLHFDTASHNNGPYCR